MIRCVRRLAFSGKETDLIVPTGVKTLGKLSAAVQTSCRFGKPTRLSVMGPRANYNALRAIINANDFEINPKPLEAKVVGPIVYSKEKKIQLSRAMDETSRLTSSIWDIDDPSPGERRKLLGKEGWTFLGEENNVVKGPVPVGVLQTSGASNLMFKRPAEKAEANRNGFVLAFAPEFTEVEGRDGTELKSITLHVSRIKSPPPVPAVDAEFMRPSKNILSAAGAVWNKWQNTKSSRESAPLIRAIGSHSIFLTVKMLAFAQRNPHDATGYCVYPSFSKQADGAVALMLQLLPNADLIPYDTPLEM